MSGVEPWRQGNGKICADCGELGVASIDRVSGEGWMIAEVFHVVLAIPAIAVDAAHPGDADSGAERKIFCGSGDNFADDLMSGNQARAQSWEIAFDDVKIGAADATGDHAD